MNYYSKIKYIFQLGSVALIGAILLSSTAIQTERPITAQDKALEVIEKYIEATGGREAWSKLVTKEQRTILIQFPEPEPEYLIPASPKPDSVVTESVTYYDKIQEKHKWIKLEDGSGLCHDGHSFYHISSMGKISEIAQDAGFYKAASFKMGHPELLMNLKEGDLVEYMGTDFFDSIFCDVIRFRRKEMEMFKPSLLYFRRDNSLLVVTKSDPDDFDRLTYHLKYTRVNGVLIPLETVTYHFEKLWSKGSARLRFNIDISDKLDCN